MAKLNAAFLFREPVPIRSIATMAGAAQAGLRAVATRQCAASQCCDVKTTKWDGSRCVCKSNVAVDGGGRPLAGGQLGIRPSPPKCRPGEDPKVECYQDILGGPQTCYQTCER